MYGTAWKEERTEPLTRQALRAGFRAIDTANQRKHYFEAGVGAAVRAALTERLVTRAELFLQTKFTFIDGQDHRLPYDRRASVATQVAQSFASSLEHLGTDYLDSYVLHGPSVGRGLGAADREAWHAMEELTRDGRARQLGVSNVTLEQLELLCGFAAVRPAFVQNRCYARAGWDRDVRNLCRAQGIVYQGFSLLTANARELERPAVKRIAARHRVSPAELVFRMASALGILPLTGSSSPEHLQKDLAALDLPLDPDDLSALEGITG
jgi:diketogulonate reductase-like aldo/keto reductase